MANKRVLLVEADKTFKVGIPENCKITFGPWSPPKDTGKYGGDEQQRAGTLRIYQDTKENIIACFSRVRSFRDITSVDYSELVAREEGAAVWKNDERGYEREDKAKSASVWVDEPVLALSEPVKRSGKKK